MKSMKYMVKVAICMCNLNHNLNPIWRHYTPDLVLVYLLSNGCMHWRTHQSHDGQWGLLLPTLQKLQPLMERRRVSTKNRKKNIVSQGVPGDGLSNMNGERGPPKDPLQWLRVTTHWQLAPMEKFFDSQGLYKCSFKNVWKVTFYVELSKSET